ncbi:hypothetical protein B9Z55_012751 [Caenorhabditis nigoni]|uniref:F-box domain-containing protein n=1 Tax=Caenorhabditis nigoni TaxID=1611254 RepID=A0A2G5TYU1_9PELO|nr:hypothetical protein B9Z55_012751 [Caenorhabditis nigoni]
MTSDIENLTEKTVNLSTDPIYKTNWCDMPEELKRECIGKMGFDERMLLRLTAKAERSLANSQSLMFHDGSFYIIGNHHYIDLTVDNGNDQRERKAKRNYKNPNDEFELMKYIWGVGVFENFLFFCDDPFFMEEVNYTGKIKAKNVDLVNCENGLLPKILQKMSNGVEAIKLSPDCNNLSEFPLDEILAIPQVQNSLYLQISNYDQADTLQKVAQVWINNNNSKIGFTFQLSTETHKLFNEFSKHFADRIVSESEKRVRIRTNNPDRHILLERGLDNVVTVDYHVQFFRLMVISAKMKESEYDDNCKEWISKMSSIYSFREWDNNRVQNVHVNENPENVANDEHVENREPIPEGIEDDDW